MDNFKVIYRILKYLESVMDVEETDLAPIKHERLGITHSRWEQLMIVLAEEGFITGVLYTMTQMDTRPHLAEPITPRIKLKGLEYLSDNGLIKKAARVMKGIKDVVPGV